MGLGTRKSRLRIGMVTAASGMLAAAAAVGIAGTAGAATAGAAVKAAPAAPSGGYQFVTAGSDHDRTFNQLLGINNSGVIAAYFGSGVKGHPNKGYQIPPPYSQGDIHSENFPGSVQTQVTGLNDRGVTVGFFSKQNNGNNVNNNFGWYAAGGHLHEVNFPTGTPANPPVDQLLGVNNHDIAVGFFTNGVNNFDTVVGTYTLSNGNTFGFIYKLGHGITTSSISDPNGVGTTVLNGINNEGDIVGFYTDGAGNVDGLLGYPPF